MMMMGFLGNAYPWVKAGHVIFVIFWMAGLFMLPRFYIYHQATVPGSPEDKAWIERERRLRSIIITPAMFFVWGFGLMLAFDQNLWGVHWFQAKFLTVSEKRIAHRQRRFAEDCACFAGKIDERRRLHSLQPRDLR